MRSLDGGSAPSGRRDATERRPPASPGGPTSQAAGRQSQPHSPRNTGVSLRRNASNPMR
jgi:hypothetical protein